MINLFGKKKLISEKDYDFLAKVVGSLPVKYSYLSQQVSKEFFLEKKSNPLRFPQLRGINWRTVLDIY